MGTTSPEGPGAKSPGPTPEGPGAKSPGPTPEGQAARGPGPSLEDLGHADPEVRLSACRSAAEQAGVDWIAPLVATLGDPVKAVVRTACDALVAIESRHGGAAPAVESALVAESPGVRFAAAFALGRMRPPDPRLLPALLEALAADDGDVRWAASRLLVEAGSRHAEVGERLVSLLGSTPDAGVRRMLAFALRELAGDSGAAARALLAASEDEDVHVRRAALHALSNLASPHPETIARLIRALDETDGGSRRVAALSLGALGTRVDDREAILRALHRATGGPDPDLVRAAERSLSMLTPSPSRASDPDGDPPT